MGCCFCVILEVLECLCWEGLFRLALFYRGGMGQLQEILQLPTLPE